MPSIHPKYPNVCHEHNQNNRLICGTFTSCCTRCLQERADGVELGRRVHRSSFPVKPPGHRAKTNALAWQQHETHLSPARTESVAQESTVCNRLSRKVRVDNYLGVQHGGANPHASERLIGYQCRKTRLKILSDNHQAYN
eukprot:6215400-Pyramimonas_sp.AAC.2